MTVDLQYSDGFATYTRTFQILGVHYEDAELETRLHKGLAGGYVQDSVGYHVLTTVDFQALKGDRQSLFWLYAFCFGTDRLVAFDNPDVGIENRAVTLLGTSLPIHYMNNVKYLDQFSMKFSEKALHLTGDDGSTTRILKPVYTPQATTIVGDTMTTYINLLDEGSVELVKKDFRFSGTGNRDDIAWGYLHHFTLDTGAVAGTTNRTWLRDFCLWKNKQIDTRTMDPDNGIITNVVFDGKKVEWKFLNGVKDARATTLKFFEKTARTTTQIFVPPMPAAGPAWDEPVADEGVFL